MTLASRLNIPAGVQVELTEIDSQCRTAAVGEGQAKNQKFSLTKGLSLRVIENGGQGLVTTTQADEKKMDHLFQTALGMARLSPKDPHIQLAAPAPAYPAPVPTDKSLFAENFPHLIDRLLALEKKMLALDSRISKVVRLELRESLQKSTLTNTEMLNIESESSSTTLLAEVAAQDGANMEVGWDFKSSRFSKDISLDQMAEELVLQTIQSLGGKPIPSGEYPVVMHPRVGCQLLNLIGEALSADAVQMGRSFFKDLMNGNAGSSAVTLIDDPLLPSGVGSSHVDDEGSPTQTTVLIDQGILKDFFFDLRTASKAGRKTNGHGMKSGLSAPPRPHPTNFYLKPGNKSVNELLAAHPQVFYLWDVMGLHMADPITGEFSLGANGQLYENGKLKQAVRGVTISGKLLDVLRHVSEVGSQLTWLGDRGAPPFLVSKLMVAGT